MRQVPQYGIIGNGRLAKHIQHYLKTLNIPYRTWNRKNTNNELKLLGHTCSVVLVLIADDAIAHFFKQYQSYFNDTQVVHCSAVAQVPGMLFAHPLMTFTQELYDDEIYRSIPFTICKDGPTLSSILPGFPNPSITISENQRVRYHTYCVMSGNFATILWKTMLKRLQQELKVDPILIEPYFKQINHNILKDKEPLSGPLARNDRQTIAQHLDIIKNSELESLYLSMLKLHFGEEYAVTQG